MAMRVIAVTQMMAAPLVAVGTVQSAEFGASANPIRKVVNLLQKMQKKVTDEGEKAEELYQKFMCYCKNNGGGLQANIDGALAKLPQLESSIKAASGQNDQLKSDLKSDQTDRTAAEKAISEASAIRQKDKTAYNKALAENKANLAAARKAVAAVDKGMFGSFLQTTSADVLRQFLGGKQDMANADRQEVLAFLSGKQSDEFAPGTGEVSGILKNMVDDMAKDQEEMIATEEQAIKSHDGLLAAKKKEISALQKSIETKMKRIGELGVEIAALKNDITNTQETLAQDQKFAADLKKDCGEKTGIHQEEQKIRAEEKVALADTIKILNDDDALDLFKKTLPSASSSFMQVAERTFSERERASRELSKVQGRHPRLDFILLALKGKKLGFDKIVKFIDQLVATLKKEQQDDNYKREYCAAQFDSADDQKKGLERSISDLNTDIANAKESIATLSDEIAALKAGIAALDKALTDATEQRKAENAEYKEMVASDAAAKELILFAKNRLNKFYNPKLYKAAPKRELSAGDRIYENQGGDIPTVAPGGIANTGIAAFLQVRQDDSAPPPAAAAAYMKKSGEAGGVIAMMDLLVQDLDKEMTEAEVDEKNANAAYKQLVADSAEKRRQDAKALTEKEAAKADLESSVQESSNSKKQTTRELMDTERYIAGLHAECDWLLKYFDVRKEARSDEVGSLESAKAVLAGADYALLQSSRAHKFLKRL